MTYRKAIPLLMGVCMVAGLAGCGFGGLAPIKMPTQPSQPVSILFVQAPPGTLAVNASANIDAAVENSPSNSGVVYSVACGSAGACGALTASDEAGAVVYTAPPTIPTGGTVTVTATASADATKSVSATITIVPPIPIVVSFFGTTPASLQVSAVAPMRASVTNDTSANPEVLWTVTCGGAGCGSFNPTVTTSESATTYTAPSAIPPGTSVTVTATSKTDPNKSASTNIVITPQAPTLANGAYVFQLSGPAGTQASFIAGVLVAQNGAITGGEQDSIDYSTDDDGSPYPSAYSSGEISGGSYATTPDGNLQISVWVEGGEETLSGVLASGGKGFVAQLYGSLGSGTLDLQTGTAAPAGGYAISMYGGDQFGNAAWLGGILNIDSAGGISGTGSVVDCVLEQNGGASCGTLAASTVSAPDQFGRVLFQLNPGASSALPVQDLIGYIVDSTHIRLISAALNNYGNYQGVMSGLALGQESSTGKFSNSSLAGSSYVFGASTLIEYGTYQVAGIVSANADGSLTGILNWNNLTGQGAQTPLSVNGTWTVDSTGRATLSNLTVGSISTEPFTDSLHMYLAGNGNALLLSSESANPFAGQAFLQQTGAFTAASLSGSYGLNAGVSNTTTASGGSTAIGSVASADDNGADSLSGFADSGDGAADFAISGSFIPGSNGVFTGTLTGLDAASRATADNFTLYLVDNQHAVAIETDNTQLTLGYLELQQ
jgi:hypothetical protein